MWGRTTHQQIHRSVWRWVGKRCCWQAWGEGQYLAYMCHIQLWYVVLLAEIYMSCPPLSAGRWLLTDTAKPGLNPPGDELLGR